VGNLNLLKEAVSLPLRRDDFSSDSPEWNSDIQWESACSFKSFKIFNDIFEKLLISDGMAPLRNIISFDNQIIMYAGSVLVRSECKATDFHYDWNEKCNNNAFTLITPIIHPTNGTNLLYEGNEKANKKYTYEFGRCISFGSKFIHSTDIGVSSSPSIHLSINFGTDRMQHWEAISKTTANQGKVHRLPNGIFFNKDFV
jgi:hypothetical protein